MARIRQITTKDQVPADKHDILRRRAELARMLRLVHPHSLPRSRCRHAITHGFDHTGPIAVRHHRATVQQTRYSAHSLLHVRGVDSAGCQFHQNFARAGHRLFQFS